MITVKQRRRLTPSNSLAIGAPLGGSLAVVLTGLAGAYGVPVPPEAASALGVLLTAAFSYLPRGARKGESQ